VTESRLDVPDRAAWRRWLTDHQDSVEVWLVYHKRGVEGISYNESVEEALCFGWIDGLIRTIDDNTYMRRFTPRRAGSMWSASNKRRVERLLESGLVEAGGHEAIARARADGSWDRVPDAERKWTMPVELERALGSNGGARQKFDASSPSHQREYVMWVASAKRPETRKRRAARAVEMLLRGERPT